MSLPTPGPGDVWGAQLNGVIRELTRPLDADPPIANAADDSFAGPVLDAKWVPGAMGVTTEFLDGRLLMTPGGTSKAALISQPTPGNGAISILAKVCSSAGPDMGGTSSDMRPGLFFAHAGTTRALVTGLGISGGPRQAMAIETSLYSTSGDWGQYNDNWSNNRGAQYGGEFIWFKMTWTGTAIDCYYSNNGLRWRYFYSRPWANRPDRMGVVLYSNSGSLAGNDELIVDWFRCYDLTAAPGELPDDITVDFAMNGYNGIINALGRIGTPDFVNPVSLGRVAVSSSTPRDDNTALKALDQSPASFYHSDGPANDNFWAIDFGADRRILVNRYGMMGRNTADSNFPRTWRLEGSNDASGWTTLHDHPTWTEPGPNLGTWWSAPVVTSTPYRYLRIVHYGNDSNANGYLIIAEAEFWGTLSTVS